MGKPKEKKMPFKGKALMGKAPVKKLVPGKPVVPKKPGKIKPVMPKKAGK